jgi:hypothetical protein
MLICVSGHNRLGKLHVVFFGWHHTIAEIAEAAPHLVTAWSLGCCGSAPQIATKAPEFR